MNWVELQKVIKTGVFYLRLCSFDSNFSGVSREIMIPWTRGSSNLC